MSSISGISKFGKKFTEDTGIQRLMDDMGRALEIPGEKSMFGGGNPAVVDAVSESYMDKLNQISSSKDEFTKAFGNYDTPQGNQRFIATLTKYINDKYDWGITEKNVVITPGSQTGFFELFNLLGGEQADGSHKKILFPIAPEYIGYADQGIGEDIFTANKPRIIDTGPHTFKYSVNFSELEKAGDIAALCVSRPANPTGNVITGDELRKLEVFAEEHNVPLIIDNAYGHPFPGVMNSDYVPKWNKNIIYSMSLSKVGLPGVRSGIFIASEEIVERISKINAIISLANANIGQVLVSMMIESGELDDLCENHIQPFYAEKEAFARSVIEREFDDSLPYKFHEYEGSYFYWLWLDKLPISSIEFYQRLKERGVIVVPGEYFFPGIDDENWDHKKQCLRINFSRPKDEVERGFKIIAEEMQRAYREV